MELKLILYCTNLHSAPLSYPLCLIINLDFTVLFTVNTLKDAQPASVNTTPLSYHLQHKAHWDDTVSEHTVSA